MTAIYVAALPLEPNTLIVVSHRFRSYIGLSRNGLYVHHMRPVREDEALVVDGRREPGALTCDCNGGQFRGTCYWVERAEALEAANPDAFRTRLAAPILDRPAWAPARAAIDAGSATFDAPAGAGDLQEAYRG
jgi:hypothetical protein